MAPRHDDTIYALSSGRPPAGVALVRVSGVQATAALQQLTTTLPLPRQAALRTLRDPADGSILDRAMVLRFVGPASATGEDVVELHLHGGPAVVAAVLRVMGTLPGLRLAEPGEFTRRGFDNDRFDLSQSEGLADLIGAETEAQRRLALEQAGGRLRDKVEGWRDAIIALRAEAEAWLDFAEAEDDVEAGLASAARAGEAIARLRADVAAALADAGRGMRLRDGLVIAVVGEPNVGKSSLINVLSGRDAAIVSEHAGTTRDLIELPLAVAGVGVTLIDTAGLRETSDPVEAEGIRRARARAAQADLVLHVAEALPDAPLGQVVINKIDRSGMAAGMRDGVIHVSASTGAGIAAFEAWLDDWVRAAVRPGEAALVSQLRHRQALAAALDDIDAALATDDLVLRAESLRLASRALGRITGAVGVEDVLDAIFGRFCIGK
ncbi:MAG TPA: tRNA uridine-5-carboxymethylaminomethyl(34) synthesis GTPase MnmE [Polymorphobacter sp.]|nr:tRNA uridine-5-carboxymethylaminomethyl(34) synthesis GTPase MnmE [Polymorphobacter sp.]